MKRLVCLFLVLATVCLAAGCSRESQAERQDWDVIQEQGILRVGVTQCPPFSQKGEDGVGLALIWTWSGQSATSWSWNRNLWSWIGPPGWMR